MRVPLSKGTRSTSGEIEHYGETEQKRLARLVSFFIIPKSATQTATRCAQKLVPMSTCLSNARDKNAKTSSSRLCKITFACAKLTNLRLSLPVFLRTQVETHQARVILHTFDGRNPHLRSASTSVCASSWQHVYTHANLQCIRP